MRVFKKLVGTYVREELQRIVYTISPRVFFQILEFRKTLVLVFAPSEKFPYLVECADGGHENDRRSKDIRSLG